MMKLLIVIVFLFSHSLTWANNRDVDELGRSLANYQACSAISLEIDDRKMFFYYQEMFNDTRFSILSFDVKSVKQVYSAWGNSEKTLLKLARKNLQVVCLQRFDVLSRKMMDKIATP